MTNTKSENTGEFTKRRFSLTHEVNDLIDELAENNYGGNRSACVRAAVYAMHQRRDEDELRHGLKRLQKDIEVLTEKIELLQETHPQERSPSNQDPSEANTGSSPTPGSEEFSGDSDSESQARVAREVYHVMRDQEKVRFNLDEIFAEVDYSLSSVASAIELLVRQQAVEQVDTDTSTQYRVIDS